MHLSAVAAAVYGNPTSKFALTVIEGEDPNDVRIRETTTQPFDAHKSLEVKAHLDQLIATIAATLARHREATRLPLHVIFGVAAQQFPNSTFDSSIQRAYGLKHVKGGKMRTVGTNTGPESTTMALMFALLEKHFGSVEGKEGQDIHLDIRGFEIHDFTADGSALQRTKDQSEMMTKEDDRLGRIVKRWRAKEPGAHEELIREAKAKGRALAAALFMELGAHASATRFFLTAPPQAPYVDSVMYNFIGLHPDFRNAAAAELISTLRIKHPICLKVPNRDIDKPSPPFTDVACTRMVEDMAELLGFDPRRVAMINHGPFPQTPDPQ